MTGLELPAPGAPVRGSRTGRPVMALLDLLGRRWALRVLWELREGRLPFRALQERCDGMSSSVLNQRLAELRAAEVVELSDAGYRLTPEGAGACSMVSSRCRRGQSGWAARSRAALVARGADVRPRASASRARRSTSSTVMCAPNTPRRRAGRQNSSYSGSACSAGAAAVKLGRLPCRASP